jgi:general secretion pathway protein A
MTPDLLAHLGSRRASAPDAAVDKRAATASAGDNGQRDRDVRLDGGTPAEVVALATRVDAPRATLADLLADPSVQSDRRVAFVSLFARWGVEYPPGARGLACEHARENGLECLARNGNWTKLRRFNLPAILELTTPAGSRQYVTLTALDEHTGTLDVGGRVATLPLGEIEQRWDGGFILLWKAPPFWATPIAPGQRSKPVEWLRQRLGEIDGTPLAEIDRDFYDAALAARVKAFQGSRLLVPDAIVGVETLAQLATASRTGLPLLAPRER